MVTAALILLFIIMFILLTLVIACLYFYNIGISRRKKTFLDGNPDLTVDPSAELAVFELSWLDQHPFENVEIKSYDSLLLRGYYLPAQSPTLKTVIIAHGYNSRALPDMGSFVQLYHDVFGYNVLLPDARGHGSSEGNYIGLGWHERCDYVKWIAHLIQKNGQDVQIALHGISMGGATVLMASGEMLPDQVKCIVGDCSYTSAIDILSYQLKRMYKLPAFPIMPTTSLICKLRSHYSFEEASALKQVGKTTKPILFIHGDKDDFVPTEMAHRLYKQSNAYKELVIVPGAGHGLSFATDINSYSQNVSQFLHKFIQ